MRMRLITKHLALRAPHTPRHMARLLGAPHKPIALNLNNDAFFINWRISRKVNLTNKKVFLGTLELLRHFGIMEECYGQYY